MVETKLFYKLQFCGATDCSTNHFPKVLTIENNIVFHFDVMLIENKLKPFFLPHITESNPITHLQYMDTLGIIHLDKFTEENIRATDFPTVNFRLLARNFNMFDFEIYGLNTPHFYNNIEEAELYHQHLNVCNRINNENNNEGTIPINEGKTFKNDLCTVCLERIPNVLFCLCGHICI